MRNLKIDTIKKTETPPKIVKNFIEVDRIKELLSLYNSLPLTVHNKKQNVKKKDGLAVLIQNLKTGTSKN